MKRLLICSASLLAFPITAVAQTAPAGEAEGTTTEQGIGEIVVTAQRRAENLQRTALSIEAASADDIAEAGVTRPEDIAKLATGVTVGTGGPSIPQVYIRGVGNYGTNNFAESAIAFNLDGVYIARGWGIRGSFFDLDRIEVLKGPQGTLYGRNASGGAINIISAKPKLGEYSGRFEGIFGNYDTISGEAAVNIPLGDTVALRAAGKVSRHDGYLADGYDDEQSEAARLHLLFEPNPDISLLLTGFYQHDGGKGAANTLVNGNVPFDPRLGPTQPAVGQIVNTLPNGGPPGFLLQPPITDGYNRGEVYGVSAELNWDFGPATLTVLPAYRRGTHSNRFGITQFVFDEFETDRQTSLEVRLSNESDRLKWVVGGYLFDNKQGEPEGRDLRFYTTGVGGARVYDFSASTKSKALFGQLTFSISDAFRLTGGLRYTDERKKQDGQITNYGGFDRVLGAPNCPPGYTFDPASPIAFGKCRLQTFAFGRFKDDAVNWKAGFEFDVGPQSLLYASASTGFKSGGFYAAPPPSSFNSERLTAYEVGSKNRFWDNRLQVNLEAFYYDYKDHQEASLGPTSVPGYYTLITANAGKAKSYGGAIDIILAPSPSDQFSLGVQYNKTNYDSYSYLNFTSEFGPPVTGCAVGAPSVLPGGIVTQNVDCSGFQLVRTPTWTGRASYDHVFELGDGSTLTAGASAQYSSSYYTSIEFLPSQKQGAYAMVDASITYTTPDEGLSVTLFGRNLTNKDVFTSSFRSPFINNAASGPDGMIVGTLKAPRTYGVRVSGKF